MKSSLTKTVATFSIVAILFVTLESQAQRRRTRLVNKSSTSLSQQVTSTCISNAESSGSLFESSVPEPETGIPFDKVRCLDCVTPGKAIHIPAPCYPAEAKAAHISARITVRIVVDEEGRVIWARADDGHPLLQQAAIRAACKTRFKPSTNIRLKRAVKSRGLLTYNFSLP